jgi:type II secretory pathway component GspD/PulD (secretin)
MVRHGLTALALLVWLFAAVALTAPAEPTVAPADRVRKGLDQTVTVELANQPLQQALEDLGKQTGLHIVLDRTFLLNLGIEEGIAVSVNLKEVKARTALRSMLGQYNLGYAIVGDTVFVSTQDVAIHRQLRQPVTLDLEAVALNAALKQLARQTGGNILLDPRLKAEEVQKPLTLQVEEVPLETAVRLLAELADLKAARMGNVLLVTTPERAEKLRAEPADLVPGQNGLNEVFPVPVPLMR